MITHPKITDFDTLLDLEHGKIGTETRSKFEEQSQLFIVSEMLKAARKEANMTQEELAEAVHHYHDCLNFHPYDRKRWSDLFVFRIHYGPRLP